MDQPHSQNLSSPEHVLRVALMWRGDPFAPDKPTNHPTRLAPLIAALTAERIETRPVVYFDSDARKAHDALLDSDGVLVWINPLQDGLYDRSKVDPLLREVAAAGVWVSAHPDTILKMAPRRCSIRRRIWAGERTPISIARTTSLRCAFR